MLLLHNWLGRVEAQPQQHRHHVHGAEAEEVDLPAQSLAGGMIQHPTGGDAGHRAAQVADGVHAARYDARVFAADVQAASKAVKSGCPAALPFISA